MRAREHPRSLRPRILITTTPEQLQAALHPTGPGSPPGRHGTADAVAGEAQQYGPLGPPHLAALACDATLQRVLLAPDGAVLNLGRAVRTVTPAQKFALAARDRGCVIPGCTLPADWCDAHHVTPWSGGGRSDVDNYALLCTPHHQQVHAGVWELQMQNGVPLVRPPAWMDPQRRLIRNTFTDHHERAAQLARALTKATATTAQGEPDVRDAA